MRKVYNRNKNKRFKPATGIAAKLLSGLVILMLALVIVTGCEQKDQTENGQAISSGSRNVQVASVVRKDLQSGIAAAGRIESDVYVNLSPAMGGKVEKIYVREGDNVNAGQLLAEFSDAQLIQAEQGFRNIEKNYQRVKELLKTDAIDRKSFEEVETAYIIAKTSYEQVLENTRITAPIKGKVSGISVKAGENFNPMMAPYMIRLLSAERMKGVTTISDRDYHLIKQGMPVAIRVDAYPERVFEGKVSFVSPEADLMSGTFRCEVQLTDSTNLLRHNQFARFFIVTGESKNALIIPQQAMINANTLFIADNGTARRRTVTTGLSTPSETEIISGLDEHEVVITTGNVGLADGFPVTIIK